VTYFTAVADAPTHERVDIPSWSHRSSIGLTPTGVSGRERRECLCLRANHVHGTRAAYNRDRCRCVPCTHANTRDHQRRVRHLAAARWNGADPVWVHPVATRRRLQALGAAGWSTTQLALEMGVSRSAIAYLRNARQDRMRATTATDVATLYERLWWRTPPDGSASRSERYADRNNWVPPWRWEGINLDDPAAEPHTLDVSDLDDVAIAQALAGRSVSLTPDERRQLETCLEQRGSSARHIAQLLGTSPRTVQRQRATDRRRPEKAA
jgi:DNA-binding NarL/FixJ family response regulator